MKTIKLKGNEKQYHKLNHFLAAIDLNNKGKKASKAGNK